MSSKTLFSGSLLSAISNLSDVRNRYCKTQMRAPFTLVKSRSYSINCSVYVSNNQTLNLRGPLYASRIHELPVHFPCADTVWVALRRHFLRSRAEMSVHFICKVMNIHELYFEPEISVHVWIRGRAHQFTGVWVIVNTSEHCCHRILCTDKQQ